MIDQATLASEWSAREGATARPCDNGRLAEHPAGWATGPRAPADGMRCGPPGTSCENSLPERLSRNQIMPPELTPGDRTQKKKVNLKEGSRQTQKAGHPRDSDPASAVSPGHTGARGQK